MKKKNFIPLFVFLSLLLHLLFYFGFYFFSQRSKTIPPKKDTVWIDLKSSSMPRMVDIKKPKNETVPDQAKAQSLYNQKVAKETVSPMNTQKAGSPEKRQTPPSKVSEVKEKTDSTKDSKVGLKKETDDTKKKSPAEKKQPVEKSPPEEGIRGLGKQNFEGDYMEDYQVGNRTFVNALANPQISYYMELYRKYKMTWNPRQAAMSQALTGSTRRIVCVLGVSVDSSGRLSNAFVLRSSGNRAYDAEALRTVRSTSPYTSPPSHLLKNGSLDMAWTFTLSFY